MAKVSDAFYRFRGWVLGLFALALVVIPARPSMNSRECIVRYSAVALFYVSCVALRIWARRYIGEHSRGKAHDACELVTAGPYAYVRHPLYLSNTGIALGAILLHLGFAWEALPFAAVVIVFEISLARSEDRFLEKKFGEKWHLWALKKGEKSKSLPKRSVLASFFADRSTWVWLLFCNLLLILRKVV